MRTWPESGLDLVSSPTVTSAAAAAAVGGGNGVWGDGDVVAGMDGPDEGSGSDVSIER